jgi:hypothetical protein
VVIIEPQTYGDFYTDTYIDAYGVPDGGDIYTDSYSDVYGEDNPVVITGSLVQGASSSSSPFYTATYESVYNGAELFPVSSVSAVTSTASATSSAPQLPLLGAALGAVAGDSSAVTSFASLTGRPLALRRVFFGNQIPAALSGSLVEADAGVRRVSMDFWPDSTTTPAQLDMFLASCSAAGLDAEVTLWAGEAAATFDTPGEYFAILRAYVPVIRGNGYSFVWAEQNSVIVHENALAIWYPGDDLVDVIAPAFYCDGPAPGIPGADSLAAAAAFADARDKPFGLCEFGVDHTVHTETQGDDFLAYVRNLFADRAAAGKLNGDLVYDDTGGAALAGAPASFVVLYQQAGTSL